MKSIFLLCTIGLLAPSGIAQECVVSEGYDIDLDNLESYSDREQSECCSLCAGSAGCRGWSWNSYEGGTCWLKGAQGPLVPSTGVVSGSLNGGSTDFSVIAFYTGEADLGHISFVREANKWFPQAAAQNNFTYASTNNWANLNDNFLQDYQIVLFLDTRPEDANDRAAFERYMNGGGAWIGFHFAAFALTPSAYPQDWDWYHNEFLGSGQYASNTWAPTPAFLKTETRDHGATANLPDVFTASTNEWYRWENDLTQNPEIQILLSIDPSSFPLGTSPPETWYDGYYPVVWANQRYNMMYVNMGHNAIDYANGNADASSTFESADQNQLIIDAIKTFGFGNPLKK